MWNVEGRTEDISDPVTCAHRNLGSERPHREPRTDLTIHPGIEVRRVRLDPRQRVRKQREPAQRRRISEGINSFEHIPSTQ